MRRRLVGPVAVAAALVVGSGLVSTVAWANPTAPSDDEIAAVDQAATDTAAQVAALDAEIAAGQAQVELATIDAALASAAHTQAVVDLEAAEVEQEAAVEAARVAGVELGEAQEAMGTLAMASYRNGGELAQIGALLSAEGIEDALAEATTLTVLGRNSEDVRQRLAEAEIAADVANARSTQAVEARATAASELEDSADRAEATADAAAATLASTQARQGRLVVQLADLRQTSVEMENERQAALEADRERAANEAAAAAIGVEIDVEDTATPPGDDAGSDSEPAAPAAPSRPAPSPTSSPTAPPTTRPTPAPSPSPTTRPTPAPAPSPTPRPTPAPTPPPVTQPPPSSSGAGAAALAWARTQLGKPYVWGATGPNSYDCSGLTMRAFQNAGKTIPRNSAAQFGAGTRISIDDIRPGDLIFYSNNGSQSGIYHVALYAGNGMRLQAPSTGKSVELVPMFYVNLMSTAVRI